MIIFCKYGKKETCLITWEMELSSDWDWGWEIGIERYPVPGDDSIISPPNSNCSFHDLDWRWDWEWKM